MEVVELYVTQAGWHDELWHGTIGEVYHKKNYLILMLINHKTVRYRKVRGLSGCLYHQYHVDRELVPDAIASAIRGGSL